MGASKTGLGLSAGVHGARRGATHARRQPGVAHLPAVLGGPDLTLRLLLNGELISTSPLVAMDEGEIWGFTGLPAFQRGEWTYQLVDGGGNLLAEGAVAPRSTSGLANAVVLLPKPTLLRGRTHRRYHEGVRAYLLGDYRASRAALKEVLSRKPDTPSAHLLSAMCLAASGGLLSEQFTHLEAVVASETGMPDDLQLRYLPPHVVALGLNIDITENISTEAPFDAVGATLMLARLYQGAGRLEEAIGLLQQLHEANPTEPTFRLILSDLLLAAADHEAVLEITAGAENTDDFGIALLHMQAAALTVLGHRTAGLEAFRTALSKTSGRDPELLKVVRYDRALAYEGSGLRSRARRELERIYAQDPAYEDVKERLASLGRQKQDAVRSPRTRAKPNARSVI